VKTIVFYSYKGGVGRSSLLLNVADTMARQDELRIVIADWDLHAPGLTHLYDLGDPRGDGPHRGVMDMLQDLAGEAEEVLDPYALVHPTRQSHHLPGAGELWLMPAGRVGTEEYAKQMDLLHPALAKLRPNGKPLLEWMLERIEAGFRERDERPPDYVFLDARTGLTDIGTILLSPAADRIVLVHSLNSQNLLGLEHTLRRLVGALPRGQAAHRVVRVCSPVPFGEEAWKAERMEEATRIVAEVFGCDPTEAGRMPTVLEIPYHPSLALSDRPISRSYPKSALTGVYEEAARAIGFDDHGPVVATTAAAAEAVVARREREPTAPADGDRPFPLLTRIPWNVVKPEARPADLAPGPRVPALLDGLANTVSLSQEEIARILASLGTLTPARRRKLVDIFEEEVEKFRQLSREHWPELSALRAVYWQFWRRASTRALGVDESQSRARYVAFVESLDDDLLRRECLYVDALMARKGRDETALDRARSALTASSALALVGVLDAHDLLDFHERDRLFARAAEAQPDDERVAERWGVALAHEAQALAARGDLPNARQLWRKAGELYQRALDIKPDMHEAANNWGVALDDEAQALAARGELPTARQLWRKAGELYQRALDIKPDMHEAAYNWGVALDREAQALAAKGDLPNARDLWRKAGELYQRALNIKPDMHEAANNWGIALRHEAQALAAKGDLPNARDLWRKAGELYERALNINPNMHEPAYNWGVALDREAQALAAKGDLPNARDLWRRAGELYERALNIKPDMHEAAYNWGVALDREAQALAAKGDLPNARDLWRKAGELYQRALDIKPDKHGAAYGWGNALHHEAQALAAMGDLPNARDLWRKAGELFERALDIKPDKHEAANNLFTALATHLHHASDEERPGLRKALADFPWVPLLSPYNAACRLALLDRPDEAFEALETAPIPAHVATDPDLESLHADPRWPAVVARATRKPDEALVKSATPSQSTHKTRR